MTIKEKVQAVEQIYAGLDADIARFQLETSLSCIKGCGECCKKPELEATVLELLPLAFHLVKTHRDEEIMAKLESLKDAPVCAFFTPVIPGLQAGFCTIYLHRGLTCRLFGFSASRNKEGRPVLSTCKSIKNLLPEQYEGAIAHINEGGFVPIINQYYMKLLSIDLELGNKFYPINEAIKVAIEKVWLACAYQEPEEVV